VSLAHTRSGEGPPLILIHGLGGSQGDWDPLLELLEPHHEVIAVDLPGFGGSPALPGRVVTPAQLAASVTDLLDDLGHESAHAVGNSLGAWVALEMAAAERALSVTGVCSAGLWSKVLGERPAGLNPQGLARLARPVLPVVARIPALRQAALRGILAHPERMPADAVARTLGSYASARGYEAANNGMRAGRFDLEAADLDIPITLIWGEDDYVVRPPRREPLGTRKVMLEDCGHLAMWDQPGLVAGAILETTAAALAR
jgi:pimeloyl-ACP methyl ester carboxylesterase